MVSLIEQAICYFNEPALTIRALLQGGIERVFYIDLDAHHGDMQEALLGNLEFSRAPYMNLAVGRWLELCPGRFWHCRRWRPAHRNLPVAAGFNDTEFDYLMDTVVFPLVQAFRPQVVYCRGL